ncbi:hypothetical protein [Maribacter aestuarii]|uniref:hypothetical protein n=1 Tax=Maribacter aestuarii TaxID=1130723 RepID=UPI00248AF186|nr:hypothetical protein [Maribacter aestuarii]
MRRACIFLVFVFLIQSCIPLRVAPKIDDYNVGKGKNFKRSLPEREMFIFEDPKEAYMFYDCVDMKYGLNNDNVYDDIPFEIDDKQYFFSFYETEIQDKYLNLFPFVADISLNAALDNDDMEPILSDKAEGVRRNGNWYIAIEVYSDTEKDCLTINPLSRKVVLEYLRDLKNEYLATHNYNELIFKN